MKENEMHLIAIGDIHGQEDMLYRLLNVVSPRPEDQFVFLGDYIDRGKDSCGVIKQLIQFKANFPRTVFIRGNHDQLLLDALAELKIRHDLRMRDISQEYADYSLLSDLEMFLNNGGNETLRKTTGVKTTGVKSAFSF